MTAAAAVPLSRPERPRAVLFDWDNTLVDSWATIHAALEVTLAAMGQPRWTLEETKARVRESLRDSFPRLFGPRWEEARRLYLDTFRAIHLDRLRPLPGAEAMLQAEELRAWLIAHAVEPARIVLAADLPARQPLQLEVVRP